jgi:hypothetical protein
VIRKILSFDWALWFFWIMATTWGWLLGSLLLSGLALLTAGLFVGIFQWLVLQSRIADAWRWIVATSAGWTVGYLITFFMVPREFEFLQGTVIGLTTGIAQWIVLRQALHWSAWWIIFSVIGWTTGLTLLPGILLTGTMAGGFTGFTLEVLLRNRKLSFTSPSRSL